MIDAGLAHTLENQLRFVKDRMNREPGSRSVLNEGFSVALEDARRHRPPAEGAHERPRQVMRVHVDQQVVSSKPPGGTATLLISLA